MSRVSILLGIGVIFVGGPALAQIEAVSPTRNFEGATITFDDLSPGAILLPGDAIAPGVRFGGTGDAAAERALVVDTGGGDLALRTVDVPTNGGVRPSYIAFEFDHDLDACGATVTQVVNGNGNPGAHAFDAALTDLLPFGTEPDTTFFMGHRNASATPIRAYRYAISQYPTNEVIQINDLVLSYLATNFDDFNGALFDVFQSKGKFQVTLTAAYGGATIDTPILVDPATVILRSVAHRDGDPADAGATVGDGTSGDPSDTGARTVADADVPWVPLDIAASKVPGVTRQVHTEMISLVLTGDGWLARAGFSQVPDLPRSLGEVVSQDHATGDPANDFPADSYFNVFFEVETPAAYGSLVLFNRDPFIVRTVITEFPPFGEAYVHDFEPALDYAIPLYLKGSPDILVGYLRKGIHVAGTARVPPADKEVDVHYSELPPAELPRDCGNCGTLGYLAAPLMLVGMHLMRRRFR